MIPLAAFALAGCLAVSAGSDRVLAGDLAAGFPEWTAVPPATPLALAPAPGVQRVFRVPELRRLAELWSLSPLPEREVCVTRPVAVLTAGPLLAAMQKELPAAHIELFDFSRQAAPEGALAFPVSGLRQGPAGGYWSGYVAYGGTRRFTLWARVKVTVDTARVVAAQDLKPGLALDAALVRLETREEVPAAGFAISVEEVAGKVPRRAIAAGTPLRAEWLEPAKVVLRGQTVLAEAIRGGARLELECVAEASGAIGEIIPVQNPISKRRFQARVESQGRVVATKGSL
ncbi:MAG: flagellar basal body P-ring formation chaperone FlgA [Candidatus Solibacter sp.]|jgi:flagella basal body P-ring formation protein FlgA